MTKNGTLRVSMKAEDAIDSAMLDAMAQAAGKNPANLTMTYQDGVAVFEVRNA